MNKAARRKREKYKRWGWKRSCYVRVRSAERGVIRVQRLLAKYGDIASIPKHLLHMPQKGRGDSFAPHFLHYQLYWSAKKLKYNPEMVDVYNKVDHAVCNEKPMYYKGRKILYVFMSVLVMKDKCTVYYEDKSTEDAKLTDITFDS